MEFSTPLTLPRRLVDGATARIVRSLALRERGDPLRALHHPASGARVGEARLWRGVATLVRVNLYFSPIGLESHLIFAFAPPDSEAPHFTLDAVLTGEDHMMHLDWVPKVDLAARPDHVAARYAPLTPQLAVARGLPSWRAAALSPRQLALMSPWMIAGHVSAADFAALRPVVAAYLDRWLALLREGGAGDPALAARDRVVRAALFSEEIDPVWGRVERLIGAADTAWLQRLLVTSTIEP